MKVIYKSKKDWTAQTDYLWCNLSFYGHSHYNFVMVDKEDEISFSQLVFIFNYKVKNIDYSLAIVYPYDKPISIFSSKDDDLGLYHIQAFDR